MGKIDDFIRISGINFDNLNNIDDIFLVGIEEISSYHSNDLFKHFLLLISSSIIDVINNYCSKIKPNKFVNFIMTFSNKISINVNKLIELMDSKIKSSFITHSLISEMKGFLNNEIDILSKLYLHCWDNYTSLIKNSVKLILSSYFQNYCKDQGSMKVFFIELLSSISDFVWIPKNSTETNSLKEKILTVLSNLDEQSKHLENNKQYNYTDEITDHVNRCHKIFFSEESDIKNYVPLDYIFEFYFKMIFVFFKPENDASKYLLLKTILENPSNSKTFCTLINNFTNSYKSIMLKKDEMLEPNTFRMNIESIKNFSNRYLFTIENLDFMGVEINLNIQNKKFQYLPSINSEDESFIVKFISKKIDVGNCVKLFGEYFNYKDFDKVVDIVNNKEISSSNCYSYILGTNQSIEMILKLDQYLNKYELQNINKSTRISSLTEENIQKIKIIRLIIRNKPIWILDNSLSKIESVVKNKIIEDLILTQIMNENTIIIYDPSIKINS